LYNTTKVVWYLFWNSPWGYRRCKTIKD